MDNERAGSDAQTRVDLGHRIRELRERDELTQGQLADKLGVSVNSLCRYELGDRAPDAVLMKRLAEVFRLPIGSLYEIPMSRPPRRRGRPRRMG